MNRTLINRWVILGAVLIAAILLLLSFVFSLGFSPTPQADENWQLAALTVIPGPTSTRRVLPTATHNPALGTATPIPGELALHAYVQISGTEGDGLRLRDAPGLNSEPLFLGYDAEVFQILDGPQEKDGYTWWYLIAPYDETRNGWAAASFLEWIPSP